MNEVLLPATTVFVKGPHNGTLLPFLPPMDFSPVQVQAPVAAHSPPESPDEPRPLTRASARSGDPDYRPGPRRSRTSSSFNDLEGLFSGRAAIASLHMMEEGEFDYASATAVNIMSIIQNPRVRHQPVVHRGSSLTISS